MAFPLIGNWLVWKIGRGNKVQIGMDPWIDNNDTYRLPHHLVMDMKSRGYHNLRHVAQGVRTLDMLQQCLSFEEIGLEKENANIWEHYTRNLRSCFVNLNDQEDQLTWSSNPIGNYNTRLGYKAPSLEVNNNPKPWWARLLWKFKCLSK
jgi:hypothetical protein